MLKFVSCDVVFREVPDEVTLAINLSQCPNACPGCHSPWLREDTGRELSPDVLNEMIGTYGQAVTCICFMGGDAAPLEVAALASGLRPRFKTAWYSGRPALPDGFPVQSLDYIKLGPYVEKLGPLDKSTTNQRMYRVEPDGALTDITSRFWNKRPI